MPIYEYECRCGMRLELYNSMDNRYNAICPACGRKPRLLVSKIADANPYNDHITLTVVDGDGNVVGKRHDHHRTPPFHEYHSLETRQRAEHGQEMAHTELLQEEQFKQEKKLARQV